MVPAQHSTHTPNVHPAPCIAPTPKCAASTFDPSPLTGSSKPLQLQPNTQAVDPELGSKNKTPRILLVMVRAFATNSCGKFRKSRLAMTEPETAFRVETDSPAKEPFGRRGGCPRSFALRRLRATIIVSMA